MRLLVGLLRRGRVLGAWIQLAWVDGQPSAVLYDAKGRVVSVVELDVADGVSGDPRCGQPRQAWSYRTGV